MVIIVGKDLTNSTTVRRDEHVDRAEHFTAARIFRIAELRSWGNMRIEVPD
jgi:hypothetical protein